MRDLQRSNKNLMIIYDQTTGTKIHLYYRSITTDDRLKYNSGMLNMLTKAKDINAAQRLQIEWAKDLITGFGDGDLGYEGKPISSNPESADYYANWKGLLEDTGSDLLMTFANIVFGEPNYVVKDDFFFEKKLKNTLNNGQKKKDSSS